MFINYFRHSHRRSPFNLAFARIILGTYLIWKIVWYDWQAFLSVPFTLQAEFLLLLVPQNMPFLLIIEKWIVMIAIVSFIVGYRLKTTSFLICLILGHFGVVRYTLDSSGGTTSLFIAVFFVAMLGLFSYSDTLSLDEFRRTKYRTITELNEFLQAPADREKVGMDALKWSLVVISMIYFGAGFGKIVNGPVWDWATPQNLSRIIVVRNAIKEIPLHLGETIVNFPELMWAGAWSTIVLETGFFFAVLAGITITPFVLGIFGMQAMIGLLIGPFFFDIYPLLLVFFTWDRMYHSLCSDETVYVVYDKHCYLCARSLVLFKLLDINNTVLFKDQYNAPEEFRYQFSPDYDSSMYVFRDNSSYSGYQAFRQLLKHYRIFIGFVWLMKLPIIETIGEKLYRYIADNRDRYFVCQVDR